MASDAGAVPTTIAGRCARTHPSRCSPARPSIWTDGACSGNPGPGGWAAIVIPADGGEPVELSGGERATTNNRMELTAALEGLRSLPDGSRSSS